MGSSYSAKMHKHTHKRSTICGNDTQKKRKPAALSDLENAVDSVGLQLADAREKVLVVLVVVENVVTETLFGVAAGNAAEEEIEEAVVGSEAEVDGPQDESVQPPQGGRAFRKQQLRQDMVVETLFCVSFKKSAGGAAVEPAKRTLLRPYIM